MSENEIAQPFWEFILRQITQTFLKKISHLTSFLDVDNCYDYFVSLDQIHYWEKGEKLGSYKSVKFSAEENNFILKLYRIIFNLPLVI